MAKLFLRRGAWVDSRGSENDTPLICAAYEGHILVSRSLLLHGANLRLLNNDGKSALDIAVEYGEPAVAALLRAWPAIRVLFVVRSAEEVRRLSVRSILRKIPKEISRAIGNLLV
jgi:hypothetical protein